MDNQQLIAQARQIIERAESIPDDWEQAPGFASSVHSEASEFLKRFSPPGSEMVRVLDDGRSYDSDMIRYTIIEQVKV